MYFDHGDYELSLLEPHSQYENYFLVTLKSVDFVERHITVQSL